MGVFSLTLTGNATIPHPAERALLDLAATQTGPNKQAVSDAVLTTAQHIENLIESLQNPDESGPIPEKERPIAHWSKTSLTATSHIPRPEPTRLGAAPAEEPKRLYTLRIEFDVRFRDFAALGAFSARLSALDHCEVQSIDWTLLPETQRRFKSQLRTQAAADALSKARDYCRVLCDVADDAKIVPIELRSENAPSPTMIGGGHKKRMIMHQSVQTPDDSHSFTPQEVRMNLNVQVQFEIQTKGVSLRVAEEED